MTRHQDTSFELAQRLDDVEHLTLYRELAKKMPARDLMEALAVVEGTAWPSRIPRPALFLLVLGARVGQPL